MAARNRFAIPAKLVAATVFAIGTTLADAAVLIEDLALKVDIRGRLISDLAALLQPARRFRSVGYDHRQAPGPGCRVDIGGYT